MAPKGKGQAKEAKYIWNEGLVRSFTDLCLDYQSTNGIEHPFSWVNIAVQFEEKGGKKCDREVVKHKFDHMKKLWKDWKDLKHGQTGLGWDSTKGTIVADSEWWDTKIKENPNFKKFRKKGIPPEMEDKWDQLFGSVVATGKHCVTPSMNQCPTGVMGANDIYAQVDVNESESDEEYDHLYNIDLNRPDSMMLEDVIKEVSSPMAPSAPTEKGKRKAGTLTSLDGSKRNKRNRSAGSVLYKQHLGMVGEATQKMVALLEADVTRSAAAPEKNTLKEAMDVVEELVASGELIEGSSLWCFSVTELNKEDARKLFLAISRNSARLAWLKYQYMRSSGNE